MFRCDVFVSCIWWGEIIGLFLVYVYFIFLSEEEFDYFWILVFGFK